MTLLTQLRRIFRFENLNQQALEYCLMSTSIGTLVVRDEQLAALVFTKCHRQRSAQFLLDVWPMLLETAHVKLLLASPEICMRYSQLKRPPVRLTIQSDLHAAVQADRKSVV